MWRSVVTASLTLLLSCVTVQTKDTLLIKLPNGSQLKGHDDYKSSVSGRTILSFQGIPYAQPPEGKLRYAKPKEAPKWDEILEANKQYKCSQLDLLNHKYVGQEDCLHLNVYKPEGDFDAPLPVMVWIHGGGWFAGDGTTDLYGPERLMDKDIILVTINYRLGPFGYLTMLDENLPANLGMFDMIMALKWVQQNIKSFGGDPNKVTIFGESAGSVSVLCLVLSPLAKGLFHAAIAESGTPISSFMSLDQHPSYYARSLALRAGCNPKGTSAEIKQCLLEVPADVLASRQYIDTNLIDIFPPHFIPVVDGDFLPKEPMELLQSGEFTKVPIIIGYNKDEGLMITSKYLVDSSQMSELNRNLERNIITYTTSRGTNAEITDAEKAFAKDYVDSEIDREEIPQKLEGPMLKLQDFMSDAWFNAIGQKTVEIMASKSNAPVYEYLYDHLGTTSFIDFEILPMWKILAKAAGRWLGFNFFDERPGVSHGDEVFMLYNPHMLPYDSVFTDGDRNASANMVELWTNFAKTVGNPTPEPINGVTWKKLDPANPQRLNINSKVEFGPRSKDEAGRLEKWERIWAKLPPGIFVKKQKSWSESASKFSEIKIRDEL